MKECENFLPLFYQKRLQGLFGSNIFPWLYYKNVSGLDAAEMASLCKEDSNIREGYGFQHLIYGENQKYDKRLYENLNFIELFSKAIKSKFSVEVNQILRIMVGLTLPDITYKPTQYFCPHVDRVTTHQTVIYNINTHDAGTRIFKEKFDGKPNLDKKTHIHTAISKQGSAILFDGLTYHAGAIPNMFDKLIININFV